MFSSLNGVRGAPIGQPQNEQEFLSGRNGNRTRFQPPAAGIEAPWCLRESPDGKRAHVAMDCSGASAVWQGALTSARAGRLGNLFGGCVPCSQLRLDTRRFHYAERAVKGVFHRHPVNVRDALEQATQTDLNARLLLSRERPINQVEDARRTMMRSETLKVFIRNV